MFLPPSEAGSLVKGLLIVWWLVTAASPAFCQTLPAADAATDSVQAALDQQVDFLLFEAETYIGEKDYGAAVPVLERVLALSPRRVDIWERLARAYQFWVASLPDPPEDVIDRAVQIYRSILDYEPGNRYALEGLRELGGRYAGPVLVSLRDVKAQNAWKDAEAEETRQLRRPEKDRDYTKAVTLYREALRIEPRHPGMFVKLAGLLVRTDPTSEEARKLYTEALRINPADLEALNALSGLEMAAGRYDKAEALLEVALELLEMDPPGTIRPEAAVARRQFGEVLDRLSEKDPTPRRHYYLGRLHLAEGNYSEAVKAIRTAFDADTSQVAYRKYLGIGYFNLDEMNESLGWFQKTLEVDPNDPDALYHIGSMLYDLSHYEPAIQHLKTVVDVPRYRGRASRLLGLALTRIDKHSESAAMYLEQAIKEGATDPQIRCVLGEQYLRAERWDDARGRFQECLEALPAHPAALLGSGLVADHDGNYRKAVSLLEKFLVDHPESPAVLMRLGLSYLKLGKPDSAIVKFRTAIGTDSTLTSVKPAELKPDQVLELGFLILMAGRNYEDGIVIGEHLARTSPDNAGYANNLAMAYADAGKNLDRALELSEVANEKSPDNAGFLDTLGWTYVRLKRYGEAQKTLARAIELELAEEKPEASEIYYHMAVLLSEMNQKEKAIEYLQKTLEDPANPLIEDSARKLLARLQEQ
jgi:tetratricopeptide (TPR) repeat protein